MDLDKWKKAKHGIDAEIEKQGLQLGGARRVKPMSPEQAEDRAEKIRRLTNQLEGKYEILRIFVDSANNTEVEIVKAFDDAIGREQKEVDALMKKIRDENAKPNPDESKLRQWNRQVIDENYRIDGKKLAKAAAAL